MSYEVKFGYISGHNLVFAAYQSDGAGRGIEQQPLLELREGYYGATPLTDLVAGDEVIAYALDDLEWEDDTLYCLSEDYLYWENEQLSWEGEWLVDYDTQIYNALTSVGAVVGANEYTIGTDWFGLLDGSVNDLIVGQNKVNAVYTASESTGQTQARLRELEEADVGYFKRRRFEKYGNG